MADPMRILLVNPNMTASMTDNMARIAQDLAGSDAEIVPLTATRGFPYIASRAEAQVGGAIALEMIAGNLAGADAAIIAAFGDPGLVAARELFDLPVIGMAEAAIKTATFLGERFSIVTFSPAMRRWFTDSVESCGLSARFAGVCTPETHPGNMDRMQTDLRAELIDLARLAVRRDGADVVILGGAPLAGMAADIREEVPAIVLDPISAAVVQAMAVARLNPRYSGRASRPLAKASVGLTPDLARMIGGDGGE